MAKQHSSLTGVDLHDPKGIGSENTTKILHLTQSVNQVNLSGSILPEVTDKFTLGSSSLVFKSGNFNHISASAGVTGSSISTASFGRFEGDGRGLTNIVASSVPFANITSKPENLVSGSSQIDKNVVLDESNVVSASVIASSAQGQVTLTNNGVAGTAVDLGLQVGDSPTFGGLTSTAGVNINGDSSITGSLTITGKLTAETYVVSSSVTSMSVQQASGSTIFGDSADDIHQFTGSLKILGKIKDSDIVSGSEQLAVNISGSLGSNATLIRSLTASNISGSFTSVSSSFSTTTTDTTASIAGLISDSGSVSTRVTNLEANPVFSSTSISGSFGNQRVGTTDNVVFNHITGSGNVSGSVNSTGSFGSVELDGNLTLGGGYISVNNKGVQSQLRLYCEVNNAHYVALQAPPHAEFGGNVTITLPPTTDTLVGRTTTDTLTNKTLTSPDINGGTIDDISRVSGSSVSTGSLGSLIVDGASIDFSNLPTSDPGIAGRVFRQGTDLKISTGGV